MNRTILHGISNTFVTDLAASTRHLAIDSNVPTLRTPAAMTQQELAHRAKITPEFVSLLENGRVNTSIGVIARIAAAVGIPLAAFFATDAPDTLTDDLAAITALVSAQPEEARKQALTLLRALWGVAPA